MSNWTETLVHGKTATSADPIPLWAAGIPLPHGPNARFSIRKLIGVALTLAAFALLLLVTAFPVRAADNTVRVGYQKYGTLILVKGKGNLEKALEPLGFKVEWTEFPAGPQLLEALNVGAIDIGHTGEAPPIFAQAAGAPLVYVAHEPPAPRGEAILVPADSAIQSVADLKGKTVALNKGSNVHYLLVKALEDAGLQYSDVKTAFLPPADARAAFEQGSVDAWVIWDPFQAAAEAATGARTLRNGEGIVSNHQFYFSTKDFTEANPEVVDAVVASIAEIDAWAKDNTDAVADELSASVGIPADVLKVALERQTYGIKPLDADVVAQQQAIADAFHSLGLIPEKISIADVVRRAGS
jgi:sulfonate transport system substrate-binding protein